MRTEQPAQSMLDCGPPRLVGTVTMGMGMTMRVVVGVVSATMGVAVVSAMMAMMLMIRFGS